MAIYFCVEKDIDCKPDNGCEIQNLCCAKGGAMRRLRLVKSLNEEEDYKLHGAKALLGTKICLHLVAAYLTSFMK
jgi:hypothetical protein